MEAIDIGPDYYNDLGLSISVERGGKARFKFPDAMLDIDRSEWKYQRGEIGTSHSTASLQEEWRMAI